MTTVLVVDDLSSDRLLAETYLLKHMECLVRQAADGIEALSRIEAEPPDLVLTDLQMPKMDGRELVREVRSRYPQIPVVLMTAHGSETLAVDALHDGAASYIPKSHLKERLGPTVRTVLERLRVDRTSGELFDYVESGEFTFSLASDPDLIPPLVDLLQCMATGISASDENERMRIGVALREALLNALYHGNWEMGPGSPDDEQQQDSRSLPSSDSRRNEPPYCSRRIYVNAKISPTEARFTICDEGPGFDPRILPEPSEPGNFDRISGRGVTLMRSFMDKVAYNPIGNAVTLIRRRQTPVGKPVNLSNRPAPYLQVEQVGDALVVTPLRTIGTLADIDVRTELQQVEDALEQPGVTHAVVDFGQMKYFGASLLVLLQTLGKKMESCGGSMALCNLSTVGREVLQITHLDTRWASYLSREKALSDLGGAA